MKSVASKTGDDAGDGTTTATILTQAIVNEGLKNVTAGANPMDLKRGIDKAVDLAVKKVKEIEVVKNLLPHTINPSFIIDNEKWKNLYFKLVKTDAFLLKASMKQDAVNCLKEKLDEIK